MWLIYGAAAALYLALWFLSRKERVENGEGTELIGRLFLKPASWLERRVLRRMGECRGFCKGGYARDAQGKGGLRAGGAKGRLRTAAQIRRQSELELLYPAQSGQKLRQFTVEKISRLLFILALGFAASALVYLTGKMEMRLSGDGRVHRNSYGEGSVTLELEAQLGEEKDSFVIDVEERKYSRKELEQLAEAAGQALELEIAGENESLDAVRGDLRLPGEMDGFPFEIRWESDDYSLIQSDGRVNSAGVEEKGAVVSLTAVLTYFDQEWRRDFAVRVCPPLLNAHELRRAKILEQLRSADEKDACSETFLLPAEAEGVRILWSERMGKGSLWILLAFLLAGGAQLYFADEEIRKKLEERDRQLLTAYPEFVSKLTLLMGAGLPVRAAFARMVSDHRKKEEGTGRSCLYEELLLVCREMESGVTELQAYEHFGFRCRLPQYRKCASLLTQNLKKGSAGLLSAMQEEAERSYEERKRHAREEGEKAGTKLLLPMVMILTVVMVLVMVPACFSFAGM